MHEKLSIEEFTKKGLGIGVSSSGKKVEVHHSVVGDELEVQLKARKKKGRIVDVLRPSKDRVLPKCQHATICGGCTWQQMDYQAQLRYKQQVIQNLYGKYFTAEIFPIIGMENPFSYRNKMEFSFSENAAQTKFLGLMIAGASKYVFNIEKCELADAWFSEALQRVRKWFEDSSETAYNSYKNVGNLRTLTLRGGIYTQQKMAILTANDEIDRTSFVKALEGLCPNIFFRRQKTAKNVRTHFHTELLQGKPFIEERLSFRGKDFYFKISPTSFFQPNTKQAEVLYEKALSFLDHSELAMDLYAGTGTISCLLSSIAKRVVAIEQNPEAVIDARENFQRNHINNVTIYEGDVGKVEGDFAKPDVVVVDPPRKGLEPKALTFLVDMSPKKIVYISCNPETQEENIQHLISHGYELKTVIPVDQFPHTYHIENIAYLEKIV